MNTSLVLPWLGMQSASAAAFRLATLALLASMAFAAFAESPASSYPAAAQAPKPRSGWERFSMKVDPRALPDEAKGGRTLRGTKLNKRGEQCFPTHEGNAFRALDMLRGPDGKPRSVFDGTNGTDELPDAIRGQNTWMLWGEGDEGFWGWLQEHNYGITDFLVLIDSRQREHRFRDAGLVNQPEMKAQKDPAN